MSHVFRFDIERTIQAVAFFLRREQGRCMNYMRLIKLLYLAEREALCESGKPITGCRVIAMQRGPVLEEVLSLVRSQHIGTPEWARHFATTHYSIQMIDDPGVGRLSRFVANKLEEIAERHENDDEWAMVEITHKLPEWIKNNPGESSKEIPLADILEAAGCRDELPRIVENARNDAKASAFFSAKSELSR